MLFLLVVGGAKDLIILPGGRVTGIVLLDSDTMVLLLCVGGMPRDGGAALLLDRDGVDLVAMEVTTMAVVVIIAA